MIRIIRHIVATVVVALSLLTSCTIEPPLKLAGQRDVDALLPEIITDISVIWDINGDWHVNWWYGWDQTDIDSWGVIDEYPEPTNYEVRSYFRGNDPEAPHIDLSRMTIYGNSFRRRFNLGYHDLLFWSNIDSDDGTQVLQVDESDVTNIIATTSRSRLSYRPASSRGNDVYNSPEIFYASHVPAFYVSDDPADYDYFDDARGVWIKHIDTELTPLVYIYLVQCVIYNNNDRIDRLTDDASISALADGVSIHTGRTSRNDIFVAYPMRFKHDLTARDGRPADIFGGKLTTFGLCDMPAWRSSRGSRYDGSRGDLHNIVSLDLHFNNSTDSVYTFDVTSQMQTQAHGGVITIEIDADTLKIPQPDVIHGSGSGFNPTVAPPDSISYDFSM